MSWASKSFFVSKTLNYHKKLSLEVYDAPMTGLVAPYGKPAHNKFENVSDPSSFLSFKENVLSSTNTMAKKFKNYLIKRSFL